MSRRWKTDFKSEKSRTARNLAHNEELCKSLIQGLFSGQGNEPVSKMLFGKNPLSHCGCEAIAVYNIMQLLGLEQPLYRVITEFELNGLSMLFFSTFFGASPKKLGRYFTAHGVDFTYIKKREEFIKTAQNRPFGIAAFWVNTYSKHRFNRFGSGMHTVAFTKAEDGTISVFNRYNGDTQPRIYKNLEELLDDRKFISGYVF